MSLAFLAAGSHTYARAEERVIARRDRRTRSAGGSTAPAGPLPAGVSCHRGSRTLLSSSGATAPIGAGDAADRGTDAPWALMEPRGVRA